MSRSMWQHWQRAVEDAVQDIAVHFRQLDSSHRRYIILVSAGTFLLLARVFVKKTIAVFEKSPPQLYGLPFIGSLASMIIWNKQFSSKLLPKYGDIVSYNIGPIKFYKLNDCQLATKLFEKVLDRDPAFAQSIENGGLEPGLGVINDDKQWDFRRKTLMRNLNIVLNHSQVNENIGKALKLSVFGDLEMNLKESKNDYYLWYPKKYIRITIFNVIYMALFDKTVKSNDKTFIEYNTAVENIFAKILSSFMVEYLPSFIGQPLFGQDAKIYNESNVKLTKLIENDFDELLSKTNNNNDTSNNNSIVGNIIKEYSLNQEKNKFSKKQLIADLFGLIIAGMDTTGHATEVGILLLSKYPNLQSILFDELKSVYGENEFNLSKINECAKFRAFCHESLRIACPASGTGLGHCCHKDLRCIKYKNQNNENDCIIICDFNDSPKWPNTISKYNENKNENYCMEYDYIIEKNAVMELNLLHILTTNSKIWNLDNDPKTPNLNYWLVKDEASGNIQFKMNKNSIPFGVGKRNCMGQALALKELYAFLGHLILNFKVSAHNDDPQNMNIPFNYGGITHSIDPPTPVKIQKRN